VPEGPQNDELGIIPKWRINKGFGIAQFKDFHVIVRVWSVTRDATHTPARLSLCLLCRLCLICFRNSIASPTCDLSKINVSKSL
jgi:hypothetical protein